VSANADVAATAIATYLVEVGVLSIADQISAIRRNYAQTWKATLLRHGFDDVADMPVSDVADGVDLALSRLVDAAQEVYDLCGISQLPYDDCDGQHDGECQWKCGTCGCNWATCECTADTIMATPTAAGKTKPAGAYL
jgi:hypothetical protein